MFLIGGRVADSRSKTLKKYFYWWQSGRRQNKDTGIFLNGWQSGRQQTTNTEIFRFLNWWQSGRRRNTDTEKIFLLVVEWQTAEQGH